MSNKFKLSSETILQLIKDQINILSDSEKIDIAQMMLNKSDGGRYLWCPQTPTTGTKVDIETILFIAQPIKKNAKISLVTGEEIIYKVLDMDLLSYVELHFEKFKCLDQVNGILVNMDMVKWYDSDMNRVYFSMEHSIQVTGAAIKNILPKFKDKQLDLFLQREESKKGAYSPMGLKFTKKLT